MKEETPPNTADKIKAKAAEHFYDKENQDTYLNVPFDTVLQAIEFGYSLTTTPTSGQEGEETDSRKYFPLDERLRKIDLISDAVETEYCVKYDMALKLAEAQIETLETHIKELEGGQEVSREGVRWVRASERLPKDTAIYRTPKRDGMRRVFELSPKTNIETFFGSIPINDIEWLEEGVAASTPTNKGQEREEDRIIDLLDFVNKNALPRITGRWSVKGANKPLTHEDLYKLFCEGQEKEREVKP